MEGIQKRIITRKKTKENACFVPFIQSLRTFPSPSVQNALTNDTVMLCATILGDMRNIDAFLKQSHLHSQAVCHTYLDLPIPGGYACRVFTQKPKLINLYETVLRLVC